MGHQRPSLQQESAPGEVACCCCCCCLTNLHSQKLHHNTIFFIFKILFTLLFSLSRNLGSLAWVRLQQPQEQRYPVLQVHAGPFCVSVIHQTLTCTTESLTRVCAHSFWVHLQRISTTFLTWHAQDLFHQQTHCSTSNQPTGKCTKCNVFPAVRLPFTAGAYLQALWHKLVMKSFKPLGAIGREKTTLLNCANSNMHQHVSLVFYTHRKHPVGKLSASAKPTNQNNGKRN